MGGVEETFGCCYGAVQTDGASPLYIASQEGHVDVVRALVEAGATVDQAMVSRCAGVVYRGHALVLPGVRCGCAVVCVCAVMAGCGAV